MRIRFHEGCASESVFFIAIIGACPNENFVSRDLAIFDYSDRLLVPYGVSLTSSLLFGAAVAAVLYDNLGFSSGTR
jgi:hypothetical protein